MANLSCSSKCIKYLLFVLNLVFWLCGAVLMGFGISILVSKNTIEEFLEISVPSDSLVHWAGATLVIVGTLIFLVTLLGCCGVCRESTGCLTAYSLFLILVLALQIVSVILAASLHNEVSKLIDTEMKDSMYNDYGEEPNNTTENVYNRTLAWDNLQSKAKCCGLNNPWDWNATMWYNSTHTNISEPASVPLSCCVKHNNSHVKDEELCYLAAYHQSIGNATNREDWVHTKGCETKLNDWVRDQLAVIVGVTVGIILVQIIVVIMACILRSGIKTAGASYEHV